MSVVLAEIDRLIDWYEKHKPGAGQRVPVDLLPTALSKALEGRAATRINDRQWEYRGRIIEATKQDAKRYV